MDMHHDVELVELINWGREGFDRAERPTGAALDGGSIPPASTNNEMKKQEGER